MPGGNDVYFVDDPQTEIIEPVGGGTDTVYASTDYKLRFGSEIEILRANAGAAGLVLTGNEFDNVIVGGDGDDSLRGLAGSDTLDGGDGNDSLDGGSGVDLMAGGMGDDAYFVNDPDDQVVESDGEGTDTVFVSTSYTLAASSSIEFLRANPNAAQVAIRGNDLDNVITGGDGNDALDGAGGDDALAGGAGNDTILGGAGSDRLDGGSGVDVLIGGTGNDIYNVDDAGDAVVEFVDGGFDTVWTTTSYALQAGSEIEVLRAVGPAGVTLTGNEFANTIIGSAAADVLDGQGGDDALFGDGGSDVLLGGGGNDRLDGGAGADAMAGGAGNDIYIVDNATDAVIEDANGGSDTIFATVDYTLQAETSVETLRAHPSAGGLTLTGNELANTLVGGSGADTLNGGGGDDTLVGGAGADVFLFAFDSGNDTVADFTSGEDVISLDWPDFTDFGDVVASASQSGTDTVITLDADTSVTLKDVVLASLGASDFTFA